MHQKNWRVITVIQNLKESIRKRVLVAKFFRHWTLERHNEELAARVNELTTQMLSSNGKYGREKQRRMAAEYDLAEVEQQRVAAEERAARLEDQLDAARKNYVEIWAVKTATIDLQKLLQRSTDVTHLRELEEQIAYLEKEVADQAGTIKALMAEIQEEQHKRKEFAEIVSRYGAGIQAAAGEHQA